MPMNFPNVGTRLPKYDRRNAETKLFLLLHASSMLKIQWFGFLSGRKRTN